MRKNSSIVPQNGGKNNCTSHAMNGIGTQVKQITAANEELKHRGLHSRPFFWDKTRRDWRALPELLRPWPDYLCIVLLLGKISGKIQDGMGLLSNTREILEWSWNELKSKTFLEIRYWTRNFLHSIFFNTRPTKTIFEKIKWPLLLASRGKWDIFGCQCL